MPYISTETVDKLSIPFGIVIGPCTVLSNIIKLIRDIARIVFNGSHYSPSDAYKKFKAADLAWEQQVSPKYKPQVSDGGYIEMSTAYDPEYNKIVNNARGTPVFFNWSSSYRALSSQDKKQLNFEQAKPDARQHLTFIGIGMIRSIPLVGGVARCLYNTTKK